MQEQFQVQNIKCGGCIQAIESGLATLSGVDKVSATLEGQVKVSGTQLDRRALAAKLAALGYPERT